MAALGKARGFGQSGTHAHYAGEFGHAHSQRLAKSTEAVRATHARVGVAALRIEKATTARDAARVTAKKTAAHAKKRTDEMSKNPTAATVKAADAARHRAMVAHAAVHTHEHEVARHIASHKAAITRHALAAALLEETVRSANFTPRHAPVVQLRARGVGFDRIHGEHDTGAQGLSETPHWHFGDVMRRVHGADEHPADTSHEQYSHPLRSEASRTPLLDRLSSTRPAPAAPRPLPSKQEDYETRVRQSEKTRTDKRRIYDRDMAMLTKRNRESVDGLPPVASAVSLPQMRVSPMSLKKFDAWLKKQQIARAKTLDEARWLRR